MLEIDPSRTVSLRRESHFHFTRFRQVWFVLALGGNFAGHQELFRRLSPENFSPVAFRAVGLFAVAASADAAFENGALQGRVSDVMAARPPTIEARGEYLKRAFRAGFHRDALPFRCVLHGSSALDRLLCAAHCSSFFGVFFVATFVAIFFATSGAALGTSSTLREYFEQFWGQALQAFRAKSQSPPDATGTAGDFPRPGPPRVLRL